MPSSKYPYLSVNGEFFNKEFLNSVVHHLHKMAPIWDAGIDTPSPSDKFAYHIIKMIHHTRYEGTSNE